MKSVPRIASATAFSIATMMSPHAVLAQGPTTLPIGAATVVRLDSGPQDFSLDLRADQAVIIDLTPLDRPPTPAVAVAAVDDSEDDEALESVPGEAGASLRLLDASGTCLRAVPEDAECGQTGARLRAFDTVPENGAVRLA